MQILVIAVWSIVAFMALSAIALSTKKLVDLRKGKGFQQDLPVASVVLVIGIVLIVLACSQIYFAF